ncbi:MAG: hypothetical protein ACXW1D_00745 [Halobacteriota archaeon]
MDMMWIIQSLIGLSLAVGGFLYKDLKAKVDKTQEDFLMYKTHVSEVYATQPQLTRAIEAVGKTIDGVAATVGRIEERLYKVSHTTNSN